jgi:hypothetical protein
LDNKKATTGLSTLVFLIIFIASALILLVYYMTLGNVATEVNEGMACRIMLSAQNIAEGIPLVDVENQCRTLSKTLPEKGRTILSLKAELADLIANTAWIIHHGNVADAWDKNFMDKDACFIVYTVSFEPTRRLSDISFTGIDLVNYLGTTTYTILDDLPYTYTDYILNHPSTKEDAQINLLIKNTTIQTQQTYAISVTSGSKDSSFWTILDSAATGTSIGMIAGAGVGAMFAGVGAIPGTIIGGVGGFFSGIASGAYKAAFETNKNLYTISFLPLEEAIQAKCFTR